MPYSITVHEPEADETTERCQLGTSSIKMNANMPEPFRIALADLAAALAEKYGSDKITFHSLEFSRSSFVRPAADQYGRT